MSVEAVKQCKVIRTQHSLSTTTTRKCPVPSKKLLNWVDQWTWDKQKPNLTAALRKEMSCYRPTNPVLLYRSQHITSKPQPYQSWSHDKDMVKAMTFDFAERGKSMMMTRYVKPEEILMDFTLLPKKYRGDLLNEVLVYSANPCF